ncbi:hypothetical protein HQQ81_06895 [Microbacteriaceae bacterium VKM Ac-2854]|nr:hypothetical protein [Microbacteriaceae bacterium VKM Ac-2854]
MPELPEHDSRSTSPVESRDTAQGPPRRLLVGATAAVGAAGAITAIGGPAEAWAAPAVRQILGVPGAAASTTAVTARIRFEGEQTVSNAAGTLVTLPASIVLLNTSTDVTFASGALIFLELTYARNVLTLDREASASAATIDGAAAPGAIAADGELFVLLVPLQPGSSIVIPIVASVRERVTSSVNGVANITYTHDVPIDAPVEDRSDTAVTTIANPSPDLAHFELGFRGTRSTAPDSQGRTYDFPEFFTVTRTAAGIEQGVTSLYVAVTSADFPFAIGATDPLLDGVAADVGSWYAGGQRWAEEPYFAATFPQDSEGVIEFPLYALDVQDDPWPGWTGEFTLTATSSTATTSATTTVTIGTPRTTPFDAGVALSGSLDYAGVGGLPTQLHLTAVGTASVPSGTVLIMRRSWATYSRLTGIGTVTVDGAPAPEALVFIDAPGAYESYIHRFVLRNDVPAGRQLTIPLQWIEQQAAPGNSEEATIVSLVTAGRDSDSTNNTASQPFSYVGPPIG